MIHWLNDFGLLAQISRWRRLGDGLHRRGPRTDLTDLIPVAIGLVLVGLAIAAFAYWRKRNDLTIHCDDSNKLFRELSQAHHLNRTSQRLLMQLAHAANLKEPAEVFLTPSAFQPERLPPNLQSQSDRIETLRHQLF